MVGGSGRGGLCEPEEFAVAFDEQVAAFDRGGLLGVGDLVLPGEPVAPPLGPSGITIAGGEGS